MYGKPIVVNPNTQSSDRTGNQRVGPNGSHRSNPAPQQQMMQRGGPPRDRDVFRGPNGVVPPGVAEILMNKLARVTPMTSGQPGHARLATDPMAAHRPQQNGNRGQNGHNRTATQLPPQGYGHGLPGPGPQGAGPRRPQGSPGQLPRGSVNGSTNGHPQMGRPGQNQPPALKPPQTYPGQQGPGQMASPHSPQQQTTASPASQMQPETQYWNQPQQQQQARGPTTSVQTLPVLPLQPTQTDDPQADAIRDQLANCEMIYEFGGAYLDRYVGHNNNMPRQTIWITSEPHGHPDHKLVGYQMGLDVTLMCMKPTYDPMRVPTFVAATTVTPQPNVVARLYERQQKQLHGQPGEAKGHPQPQSPSFPDQPLRPVAA